jgi:hypothetical protein
MTIIQVEMRYIRPTVYWLPGFISYLDIAITFAKPLISDFILDTKTRLMPPMNHLIPHLPKISCQKRFSKTDLMDPLRLINADVHPAYVSVYTILCVCNMNLPKSPLKSYLQIAGCRSPRQMVANDRARTRRMDLISRIILEE